MLSSTRTLCWWEMWALFLWMSKNRRYRTETPGLVEVNKNKGGRIRRPLPLCIPHRMSIPNRFRLSRLTSFFFTCAICSSSPCSRPFISSLPNANVLPRVIAYRSPRFFFPRLTGSRTYLRGMFSSSFTHVQFIPIGFPCSHRSLLAKLLMHP